MNFKNKLITIICLMIFLLSACNGGVNPNPSNIVDPPNTGVEIPDNNSENPNNGDETPDNEDDPVLEEPVDDVRTFFQTSWDYNPAWALPADCVVLSNYDRGINKIATYVQNWLGRGYKSIAVQFPLGREDIAEYINGSYDGDTHEDIYQLDSDGEQLIYYENIEPYIYPSEGYARYVADCAKVAIAAGADRIHLEEPDAFAVGVYGDYLKQQYLKKYGTSFTNTPSTVEKMKAQMLSAEIFTEACRIVADEVKSEYPDAKVFISTHMMSSYITFPIIANNTATVRLESIDGIVTQAWSDTVHTPFTSEGVYQKRPFESGYVQYSEGINYTRGTSKPFITLADPSGDNESAFLYPNNEAYAKSIWEQTIISQFMIPETSRFHICPWPERAFYNASRDYRAVQEAIFNISRELYKKDVTTFSGTNGVAIGISHTIGVHAANFATTQQTENMIFGITVPLVRQGIPIDVVSLETLTDVSMLDDIKVLILSYDFYKPLSSLSHDIIVQWVKNGGSLIYIGGENESQNHSLWWQEAGFNSAQSDLINRLDISATQSLFGNSGTTLNSTLGFENIVVPSGFSLTSSNITGDFTPIFKSGSDNIVVEKKIGEGNVIFAGVEPMYFSLNSDSFALYDALLKRALGDNYFAPKLMHTTRGNLEIVKTFDTTYSLEGTFIDMFSENFDIIVDPEIQKESHALYMRVGDEDSLKVAATNGEISSVVLNGERSAIAITLSTVVGSKANLAVMIPQGKSVKSVFVRNASTNVNMSNTTWNYDDDTRICLITYPMNATHQVRITINTA